MNKNSFVLEIFIAFLVVAVGSFVGLEFSSNLTPPSVGSASYESPAHVATSSNMEIGPQQIKTIFVARSFCEDRVVSVPNGGAALRISFDPNIIPNATTGVIVAASGTTDFPALRYGCGNVTAYASASTTITKTETTQ